MPRVVVGKPDKPGFFTTSWSPPELAVRFPDRCPHCGGPATRQRRYSTARATALRGGGADETHLGFDVPVCSRVWPAIITRLAIVFFAFWATVFGLRALFSIHGGPLEIALGLFALAAAGMAWAWRAHTWFRVVTFDRGSITFSARRRDYAAELARLNAT